MFDVNHNFILQYTTYVQAQVILLCKQNIIQRAPTWVEAQFLQSQNYFCYVPENDREVDILVWNCSIWGCFRCTRGLWVFRGQDTAATAWWVVGRRDATVALAVVDTEAFRIGRGGSSSTPHSPHVKYFAINRATISFEGLISL